MESLRWSDRPELRRPILVAAFEGWNDAGDAASGAVRWFADRWDADPFAEIDAEDYFDFTSTRPEVRIEDGERVIDWPSNAFSHASIPGTERDVILLEGVEPHLRWRTFCDHVVEVARTHDVGLVVTLGALLAEVPHTRPVDVIGTAYDPAVVDRMGLTPSHYQGPTGIVGVLHAHCRRAGLDSVSMWASVPSYVPGAPSPKATLALVRATAELLGTPVVTTDLEIASASYERQLDELVDDDEDTASYVAALEARHDEDLGSQLGPMPGDLVEEVERFLREQE